MSQSNYDYMCLSHGQTVFLQPKACEYDSDDDPCEYAWVDLTPVDPVEAATQAHWTGLAAAEGGET